MGVVVVLALLGSLLGSYALRATELQLSRAEFAKYSEAAWAHYEKQCKARAGEKIYRTVEDVKGILLWNPRRKATDAQLRDRDWRGDPYGNDVFLSGGEIRNYLGDLNTRDQAVLRSTSRPGYSFVETREGDGTYVRHVIDHKESKIVAFPVKALESKFRIVWDDISTDEDRKYWVAGGRLRVLALDTNEVLAERIGYLIEPQFGSQSGGRVPWGHARFMSSDRAACPPFPPKNIVPINRLFVQKVLKPAPHETNGK